MMADVDPDDFFEEDEPIETVRYVFEHGEKFVTAPPSRGLTRTHLPECPQRPRRRGER